MRKTLAEKAEVLSENLQEQYSYNLEKEEAGAGDSGVSMAEKMTVKR